MVKVKVADGLGRRTEELKYWRYLWEHEFEREMNDMRYDSFKSTGEVEGIHAYTRR